MKTAPKRPSGLFYRIFGTLVITVLGAAITAAVGTWLVADQVSQRRIGDAIAILTDEHDALVAALDDPAALDELVEALESRLDGRVAVYELTRRTRVTGHGPPEFRHGEAALRRLRRGHAHIQRLRGGGPDSVVMVPLTDPHTREVVASVHVAPASQSSTLPIVVMGGLMLVLLGLGAGVLSRSFTRRLERLERSAERIARGELGHRVVLDRVKPRDEIDELGLAFNEMANKVQALVLGQQHLLANVSHELRTPIARLKVLLEILDERMDGLRTRNDPHDLERLSAGLVDMRTDTAEIERLIADLLTSGRLELRAGTRAALELAHMPLGPLLERMAARVGATVEGDLTVEIDGDAILLERLVSNLLVNARRACPEGAVTIHVHALPEHVMFVVEDEGPGIAAADRERIFEPFHRLDAARSRDHGGVGLGLYLCRQIARAHGGDIVATARPDGRSGARFEVTLTRTAHAPA